MKPLAILVLGPAALSAILSLGLVLAFPALRDPADILLTCLVGLISGLIVFGPVALASRYRFILRRWLFKHGKTVQLIAAPTMLTSLAVLLLALPLHWHGYITGLAYATLVLAVQAKVICLIALRGGEEPPSHGGRGPRPPLAPVLDPDGGRPPVLWDAAKLQAD